MESLCLHVVPVCNDDLLEARYKLANILTQDVKSSPGCLDHETVENAKEYLLYNY